MNELIGLAYYAEIPAVLIDVQRAPLVGRVSMDLITVDVSDLPAVAVGTPVELWGAQLPVDDGSLGALLSGPRWRLRSNKFGQDIPGLEIPLIPCSPPPFQQDNIKYEIGARTTTVINLLDWSVPGGSPLADSRAWVDYNFNPFIAVNPNTNVSSNGTPMTDDLDLVVYVKGDRKPTVLYSARLELSYSGVPDPVFGDGFE